MCGSKVIRDALPRLRCNGRGSLRVLIAVGQSKHLNGTTLSGGPNAVGCCAHVHGFRFFGLVSVLNPRTHSLGLIRCERQPYFVFFAFVFFCVSFDDEKPVTKEREK